MRFWNANWMQVEDYLQRDDRVLVPLGSTEQHGYLFPGVDATRSPLLNRPLKGRSTK